MNRHQPEGGIIEKVIGFDESIYAALLVGALLDYLKTHDLGKIVGADGMMRIFPVLVRIPDTAFISWERYPKRKRRRGGIPLVVPDLIVEVLSEGDTLDGGDVLPGCAISIRNWFAEARRSAVRSVRPK